MVALDRAAAARAVHAHLHPQALPRLSAALDGVGEDVERQFDLRGQQVEAEVGQVLLFLLKIDYLPAELLQQHVLRPQFLSLEVKLLP